MANRIISGNIILIDSGLNILPYVSNRIAAVGFYGSDTTSRLVLTLNSNTTNAIVAFAPPVTGAGPWSDHKAMSGKDGVYLNDTMYALNLTNGTGWVYLV